MKTVFLIYDLILKYLNFFIIISCLSSTFLKASDDLGQQPVVETARKMLGAAQPTEQSAHSLHFVYINQSPTWDACLAPSAQMGEMAQSLQEWKLLNPGTPVQVWHYNESYEQLAESSFHFPPGVQLRNMDEVIEAMPGILAELYPQHDLAARAQAMLPKIFLSTKVAVKDFFKH